MTEIRFDTLNEFKIHCKEHDITPIVQLKSQKHQDRKGNYLHDVYGFFNIAGKVINFVVEENIGFAEKKEPMYNGYKLSIL